MYPPVKKPGIKIIKQHCKGCCVRHRYLMSVNTKRSFKLKSFKKINLYGKCKEIVLFLHIDNKVFNKKHLNLLIVNTRTKRVTRIDPSNSKSTKIEPSNVKKELKRYFTTLGYHYMGMDPRSKVIKHHSQCRFAAPYLYIYGKKLTSKKLDKLIKNFYKKNNV